MQKEHVRRAPSRRTLSSFERWHTSRNPSEDRWKLIFGQIEDLHSGLLPSRDPAFQLNTRGLLVLR